MSDLYKIEKGIPIPYDAKGGKGGKWTLIARAMEVGDSVVVNGRVEAMSMRNAITKLGFKCVTRGNDRPQTRVWKVAKK